MSWTLIASLAGLCMLLRLSAPILLRGRQLPRSVEARLERAVSPLLASLFALQMFSTQGAWHLDVRLVGIVGAGILFSLKRSMPAAIAIAAALTALARLVA